MYQLTTATKKLLQLNKRVRGIAGGTSASKTISILLWLIDYAQSAKEAVVISVVSESMPHLKRGVMRDFLNIMREHNYYRDENWNRTDFIYDFSTDDKRKIIEFFSADQPSKVRGPRRDILFINEANNIVGGYETFTQLEIRTKSIIWLDWNPVSEFWFYTDILGKRDDLDFLTLTYKDNEALDPAIVSTIEARKGNVNWWRVYGEGQLGEAEGRIYTGWNITLDSIPEGARLERYGLDFGYSNDPTAIIAIYQFNNSFVFDEIAYIKGVSNKDIADMLKNLDKKLVIADSAEPKSIDEIRKYGINIIATKKGKDSILQGIQYVQDQQVYVTKRSTNLIKEYRNYLWLTDDEGKPMNEPQGFLNHALDAIRYGLDSFRPKGDYVQPNNFGGVKPLYPGLFFNR